MWVKIINTQHVQFEKAQRYDTFNNTVIGTHPEHTGHRRSLLWADHYVWLSAEVPDLSWLDSPGG